MKINKKTIMMLACVTLLFAACGDTDVSEHPYDNKIFISSSVFTKKILFQKNSTDIDTELTVSIAKPETREVKVVMKAAPELIELYKSVYYEEDVVVLPKEFYNIEESTLVINPGTVHSTSFPIHFQDIGLLDENTTYVLPITISSTNGVKILNSAKNYYYVFKGASLIDVVCNLKENRAYPDFNDDQKFAMRDHTMEMLFRIDALPNKISTLMGVEGHYLLRLGDTAPKNQLQVAGVRKVTSPELQLEIGVWYHLAVVSQSGYVTIYVNGKKKLENADAGPERINISRKHNDEKDGDASRCFWIGYSFEPTRFFDGVMAEIRIWNRALAEEEIQAPNHFYTVNPDSEGLIAYWKFNEGAGNVVKDYSSSGYDLIIERPAMWEPISLP